MTSPSVFLFTPIRYWGIAQSNTPMVSVLKIVGVLLRAIPQPGIAQSNTPMISSSISECIPLRGTSLTWRKSLFTSFSREVYVPSPILLTYGNWDLCNIALLELAILGHVVPSLVLRYQVRIFLRNFASLFNKPATYSSLSYLCNSILLTGYEPRLLNFYLPKLNNLRVTGRTRTESISRENLRLSTQIHTLRCQLFWILNRVHHPELPKFLGLRTSAHSATYTDSGE